jgi:GNAT superfamily N-acetyltransferase
MRARLRDGTPIEIVRVGPESRERLRDGFEHWSEEWRYRRFTGFRKSLSERELERLTELDHHDHEALAARDPATGYSIGIARYERLPARPGVAEAAIAVADEWQGRGVASVLLRALAERAREEGIESFLATMLRDNRRVVDLFARLGPLRAERMDQGTIEIEVELTEKP